MTTDITQAWEIGDCLDLMKDYQDNHFDLIITDPPYGINVCKTGKMGGDVLAKNTDYGECTWDVDRIGKEYFDEMMRVSKNQIIFGGNYYTDYLHPTSCWLVWNKENGKNNFADCELAWTSFDSAVRMFTFRWQGMLQGNMKKKEKRVHPTQKPVPLFKWIIEKYSKEGDLILDPFLGSGTTLEACRYTDRSCVGFEISDKWESSYPHRILKHNKRLDDWFGS